jgi:hypothetical protein
MVTILHRLAREQTALENTDFNLGRKQQEEALCEVGYMEFIIYILFYIY